MVDHRQLQVDHELVVTRMHNKDGLNCSNNSSVFFLWVSLLMAAVV